MNSYITSSKIINGKNILPIKRLQIFSPEEWELFIEEWIDIKKSDYIDVIRLGGAGDQGRDVVAYITDPKGKDYQWDCYQCKHYYKPLMPSQMWVEFGKLLYYTSIGEFPVPNKYFFVAPHGCGTSLVKLLQDPLKLKKAIKDSWDKNISEEIVSGKKIKLEGSLLNHVDHFDYAIFDRILPKKVIEEHKLHPNHLLWFGGGLPERTKFDETTISATITSQEMNYVGQLLLAYGSDCSLIYKSVDDIAPGCNYEKHFKRARINFHHAEQLRNFSRDNLPAGTFEDFQDEIFDGVINIAEDRHSNGYVKVKAVETQSVTVQITSNALKDVSNVKDKSGVCHQLCNDGKLIWIEQ